MGEHMTVLDQNKEEKVKDHDYLLNNTSSMSHQAEISEQPIVL